MASTKNKAFKVGVLVFASLAILVGTIYLIGSKDNLFTPKTKVTCAFKDVRGIVEGNNVRFSGINVGNVKNIKITSDSTVVLTLAISNEYSKFIYKNSIVEINQDGLMGGKIVVISGGSIDAKPIENWDNLMVKAGIDIGNYLTKMNDLFDEASIIIESLKSITCKIDSGNGDIARLLNQDDLTTELKITTQRLNATLANASQITSKINSGNGDLAKLINDNEITTQTSKILANLNSTSKKADAAVKELQIATRSINSGDGAVNYLLNNPKLTHDLDTTIQNVNTSLAQFNKTAQAIEKSWIIQLFSKSKKKKDKKRQENQVDTICR